jgi:hypothetical protein
MNAKTMKAFVGIVGAVAAALLYFPNIMQFNALASKVDCMAADKTYERARQFYRQAKRDCDANPKDTEACEDADYWKERKDIAKAVLEQCGGKNA